MDAHMLSLSALAWPLLCDMLSGLESGDRVRYPAGKLSRRQLIVQQVFCWSFVRLQNTYFIATECRREISGEAAQTSHEVHIVNWNTGILEAESA